MLDGPSERDPHGSVIERVGSESRIELTFDRPSQINPEPRIGAFGRLVVEDAKFLILVGQDPLFGFGWHM